MSSSRFHREFQTLTTLIIVATTASFLSGCSGRKVDENDPVSMYQDAEDEVSSDHYQLAIDKLRAVKNKFPYSKSAVDAQLRIADVLYMQDSFGEAALAYESFRDLHPKHEKVAYAMFNIGRSYFADIPGTVARDLSAAQKALDALNDFQKRFPSDPNAKEAGEMVTKTRNLLAEKELTIGNFYYKRDFFDSAKARYAKLIELYPDTSHAKEAKEKLAAIASRGSGKN